MIYKSKSGKYEKVFYFLFKTKIHKARYKSFQVDFTLIKHSICVLRIAKVGSIPSPYLGNVEEQKS